MKIRIGQYFFVVGSPFQAGHRLSQNEADALNGLRGENIRNNVKKVVDKATEALPPGEILTSADLSDLQDQVSEYARTYAFGEKREPKGGIRKTAFEQELRAVASERVAIQARQLGIELSAAGTEDAIEQQMKLAPVIDEARQRVAERTKLSRDALADLT